jgi:hypothetical protein
MKETYLRFLSNQKIPFLILDLRAMKGMKISLFGCPNKRVENI